MEITAKKEIDGNAIECTIEVDLAADAASAIEMFGADVVYSGFVANAKITAQAAMRREMVAGKDCAAIAERMKEWKPGVTLSRSPVDLLAAFKSKLSTMSEEERMAALAELGLA